MERSHAIFSTYLYYFNDVYLYQANKSFDKFSLMIRLSTGEFIDIAEFARRKK